MIIEKIIFLQNKILLNLYIEKDFTLISCVRGFYKFILKSLPGLKYHECENPNNSSFLCELKYTETAHAFEHILIEFILAHDKLINDVCGRTNWNWFINRAYTYQIEIDYADPKIYLAALDDTLKLFSAGFDQCLKNQKPKFFVRSLTPLAFTSAQKTLSAQN